MSIAWNKGWDDEDSGAWTLDREQPAPELPMKERIRGVVRLAIFIGIFTQELVQGVTAGIKQWNQRRRAS